MKFLTVDLRSLLKFILIGIIWGVVAVTAQLRNYPCWQEYWRQATPRLLFFAGFLDFLGSSFYKYYLNCKSRE